MVEERSVERHKAPSDAVRYTIMSTLKTGKYASKILSLLSASEKTPTEVAELIGVKKSNLGKYLHPLISLGLVETKTPQHIRKGKLYGLTSLGRRTLAQSVVSSQHARQIGKSVSEDVAPPKRKYNKSMENRPRQTALGPNEELRQNFQLSPELAAEQLRQIAEGLGFTINQRLLRSALGEEQKPRRSQLVTPTNSSGSENRRPTSQFLDSQPPPQNEDASSHLRVSIVGVGGAGNNLLNHAIVDGISPSRTVAVNSDRGQLSQSPARNKVLLDQTASSAAAEDMTVLNDQKMFQSAAQRVISYTDGSDLTIVVTGLGGDTGTHSAPIIAQRSRTTVRPVVSVVAIPALHERERRFIALRGLKRMAEACDCTIVIDNGVGRDYLTTTTRTTDETASIAVRSLNELLSGAEDVEARDILEVLSKGELATFCNFAFRTGDTLQSSVTEVIRSPSANLPLRKAKGALLLYRGPATMSTAQFAQAYDTLVSIACSDLAFVHGILYSHSQPSECLFLSGYTYGSSLDGFIDFVELYDVEYGQEQGELPSNWRFPPDISLFQMES